MYEVTCAVIRRFINVNFIQFVGLASKLQPLEKDKKLGKLYAVFTKIIRREKTKKPEFTCLQILCVHSCTYCKPMIYLPTFCKSHAEIFILGVPGFLKTI